MEKSCANTNSRLKNFSKQKNVRLIDDENLKENYLDTSIYEEFAEFY